MRKIVLFLLIAGFLNANSYAQAKQTQVLLKQIAALQIYIGYAQKGYSIAKKGLNIISDFKRGEFNLHTDYLNSLKQVNPKIKKYARVAEIIALQIKIIKSYKNLYAQIRQGDLFHGDEIDYIKRVFDRLIENCDTDMDELLTILTDGKLEMKDDQRMKRIDLIYQSMLDNYTFSQNFGNQAKLMSLAKEKEINETKSSRVWQNIKTTIP